MAAPVPAARRVRTLVTMGDSTAVGLGDPVPGGWRGFGPLLAAALGPVEHTNLAFTGARLGCVRARQLPAALRLRPDVAVLVAGMNDTLRSTFDPERLHADLDRVVGSLASAGTLVVTVRFHDHGRVFRLPGPLRRALRQRVEELNATADAVVRRHGALCLDLGALPDAYRPAAWSVDRLHPSELGHRILARGFAEIIAGAGFLVPTEVDLRCAGGRRVTTAHHVAWLLLRGVPWLARRGRDLGPYAVKVLITGLLQETNELPIRTVDS